jgi:hypothetical protein
MASIKSPTGPRSIHDPLLIDLSAKTNVSASTLSPLDRSSFATLSRMLSCLVTESLLHGIFVPAGDIPIKQFIGIAIVLAANTTQCDRLDDIFAIIPLRHVPIFKPKSRNKIGLLDPQDMLPFVYELDSTSQDQNDHTEVHVHFGTIELHVVSESPKCFRIHLLSLCPRLSSKVLMYAPTVTSLET